jgi:hypothetical protein
MSAFTRAARRQGRHSPALAGEPGQDVLDAAVASVLSAA